MSNLTFKELRDWIDTLDKEQQESNVSVYVDAFDEYFPIQKTEINTVDDVLHEGHPFLITPIYEEDEEKEIQHLKD